jgi:hypothetical protein
MMPRRRVTLSRHLTILTLVVVALLLFFCRAPAHAQRTYWVRSVDSLATGRVPHTHIQTTAVVSYVAKEDDGDVHIRLTSSASGAFVIGECVPELPCAAPHVGDTVTVRGIYRHDPEHGWYELHPLESVVIVHGATVTK